jgi:lipoate-protein ligase A
MDVLPREANTAVANMAANYLLLEHYPQPTHIRFRPFAWSELAYTFGVSQKWEKYRSVVPAHVPLIRRCTGGGLVSHLDDWTFALAIPPEHELFKADALESYAAVHQALMTSLLAQEMPVKLAPLPQGERVFQAPDHCAHRAEPHDVVLIEDGRKVAGASQKRSRKGLLIEGYISRPLLPDCDWLRFEKDFAEELGKVLKSKPVKVPYPIYDQSDHEGTWAKFNSASWNQRL